MSRASGWTSRGGMLVAAFAAIASVSCMQDGPTEVTRGGPNFTYASGPATVSAVGGNGVTLSMTVNTTRIVLNGPGTDLGITFDVAPSLVFPGTPQAHAAEVVFTSVRFRRDLDGYQDGITCVTGSFYVKNGMEVYAGGWPTGCSYYAPASYTVEVDAQVEWVPVHLSIHIDILNCLIDSLGPADTLFNKEMVRRALKTALDSTPPTGSPWNRRERGVIGMLEDDGTITNHLLSTGMTSSTPCSMEFPPLGPLGYTGFPAYEVHSHPFRPNDYNDPKPYSVDSVPRSNCPGLDTIPPPPVNSRYTAGAGPSWRDSLNTVEGLPALIVDPENVYILEKTGSTIRVRRVKRNGSCDPLSNAYNP